MFRITPQSYTGTALFHNQRQTSRLAHLQNQASSGLKHTRPSDNPRETSLISVLRRSISSLETQRARMEELKSPLNQSVSTLVEAGRLVTRAKQIGLQATQSIDQPDRDVLVAEMDSIITRLLDLSNDSIGGRFLFSGDSVDTRPFEIMDDPSLGVAHVQYNGTNQNAEYVISESISIQSTLTGHQVFGSNSRGETLFLGNTGSQPGVGTDSYVGRANLQIKNNGTTFESVSGLTSGTGTDTILGPPGTHSLQLEDTSGDGTSGTITLNNGESVSWTNSDTNLQVTGPRGESVFIDMSAVTAGYSGNVEIRAGGTMSIDGGRTEIQIDFSENQMVSSELTGGILNVDTRNTKFAGIEPVEFTETADALTALMELRDDIANERQLDSRAINESLTRRIGDLESVETKILDVIGIQSVALQDMEQLSAKNELDQLELKSRLGETESADLASVIVEMQSIQTTMQFNYAALSIVQSNNILDFLG